ncbi:MAG: hypothetical protein IT561_00745 [Alphaproteobacteria bacterium]|nr:hypothetical protein [Alphaproteobacteria bacterium]
MRQALSLLVAALVAALLVMALVTIVSSVLWVIGVAAAFLIIAAVIYALLTGRSKDITIRRW